MGVSIDLDTLFREAKKHKVNYSIDEKTFIKYNKIAEAEYVDKFNLLLTGVLQTTSNPKAIPVRPQDSAYALMKEISILAQDFCTVNNLNIDEGFLLYIKAGLKIMGKKYALNKFKTYNQQILSDYEIADQIRNNPLKKETEAIGKIYKERSRLPITDKDKIHFIRTAQEVIENEADIEDWMKGQFEGFEYMGKIPEPYQLYGENARIRWEKVKPDAYTLKLRELKAKNSK